MDEKLRSGIFWLIAIIAMLCLAYTQAERSASPKVKSAIIVKVDHVDSGIDDPNDYSGPGPMNPDLGNSPYSTVEESQYQPPKVTSEVANETATGWISEPPAEDESSWSIFWKNLWRK